jgi:methionyl-tRNA formyltransferase
MKIGILASGHLGFTILEKIIAHYKVDFVMTDSLSVAVINCCTTNQIPLFTGNPRNGSTSNFLEGKSCDIILSINYLFLIEKDLINFPSKYTINFHGSLLPKYRGRTPHVWAIINNETETGITAHVVDENCDTGEIIEQIIVPISTEDTGATILAKYNDLYWPLIQKVIKQVESNSVVFMPQNEFHATSFGKRTPDDGLINWTWYKERIYNWVRAQADPYPGAFTYFNGVKVIVDKVAYSNFSYRDDQENGTILNIDPLIIKTPNGAIEILVHRNPEVNFTKEIILNNDNRK